MVCSSWIYNKPLIMPGRLQQETVFVPSIFLFDYIFYFLSSDWIGQILIRGLCLHIIEVLVDTNLKFCFLSLIKSMLFIQRDLKWPDILILIFSGNPVLENLHSTTIRCSPPTLMKTCLLEPFQLHNTSTDLDKVEH